MKLRPGTPEEAGMSGERVRAIVERARGWVEDGITPALVILAARKGVIVLHEAFGVLTPELDAPPLRRDSLFPLASISKPMTATAVMILVEEGLLGLNRPVQWYIPEFVGEGKDEVMVHHLLTHTSGLEDADADAYAESTGEMEIPPLESTEHPLIHEYLVRRYAAPLSRRPGEEMSYCIFGYEMLGEIVRRITGASFADFTCERIFEPLGMSDTFWIVPDAIAPRVVQRAPNEPDAALFEQIRLAETPWACGGAYGTAIDTAIFGQMFLNGGTYSQARVLSPASVAAMTRNQTPGIGWRSRGVFIPEASWGFGWNVRGAKLRLPENEALLSPQAFCHGGTGGVFLWVDPVDQVVAVYLSVFSRGGISSGFTVSEANPFGVAGRADLFINPVMAAIVE